MKHFLNLLGVLTLTLLYACGYKETSVEVSSNLSSVSIEPLETAEGDKPWDSAKLTISDSSGKEITTANLMRDDVKLPQGPDFDLTLKYGEYRILLEYFDVMKALVYASCEESKSQLHTIKEPIYTATSKICAVSDGETSTIVIKPVLSDGENPINIPNKSSVNGEWFRCASYPDGTSVGHTYKIDITSKSITWGSIRYTRSKCDVGSADPAAMMPSFVGKILEFKDQSPLFLKYKRENGGIESIELLVEGDKLKSEMDCFYNSDSTKRGCNDVSSLFNRVK